MLRFLSPPTTQRTITHISKCHSKFASSDATNKPSSIIPDAQFPLQQPVNEPVLGYAINSPERQSVCDELAAMSKQLERIPIVINGKELQPSANGVRQQRMPHQHGDCVAEYAHANAKQLCEAIRVAGCTQKEWDRTDWPQRYAIWTKAAELAAGKYRAKLVAATMLGQGKTLVQAEIDAAAELVDFLRFAAFNAQEAQRWQPLSPQPQATKNALRLRGIDGFVAAISPFNFTAIGGNLATTPALMGNAVLWKPSETAMLSSWIVFQIMREAGLPDGVLNFVPADGPTFGRVVTESPTLAGLNFTGSVPTFAKLWQQIGTDVQRYANFPRISGECGGKNFHFVHKSAPVKTVVACTLRSAFEYSGQKCSACSRLYVPESLWTAGGLCDALVEQAGRLKIGYPTDFSTFTSAVIDQRSFERIRDAIDYAHDSTTVDVLTGGCCDDSRGWFVQPTIVKVSDPADRLMTEEIFGPVLAVYVYADAELDKAMDLVGRSTRFALTGAVFAEDVEFLAKAVDRFRMTAGNLYVNDKSTGAVVAQQPFGGARMSGTNDKSGGPAYNLRWTSMQAIKETFVPMEEVDYPYMKE